MDKKAVISILDEMGTLLELKGENPFRARAYHNASRAVEGVTQDIGSLVDSGEIREVEGIGQTIADVIADLVKKGSSRTYLDLRKGFPDGVLEMLRIQGLGPKRVKVLFEKLKIKSVEELEAAARKNKLAETPGFGEKTEQNILKAIEALRRRSDKFLYSKAEDATHSVFDSLMKEKGVQRGQVAGSMRRRKETIGDIDLILSAKSEHHQRLMEAFVNHRDVRVVLAHGETKSSVVLVSGISCDLRLVSEEEFPFALNYFSGSKEHNIEMRSRARKYGWSLNEYGFSTLDATETRGKAKRLVRCKDERDIYRALDLDYVPPELRENMGEIEAAEKHTLPELVDWDDINGTFHVHTTYSDGANTIEQMADGAGKLGWKYLGIADHSKSAAYAGGLSEDRVRRQHKEIDALNKKSKGFRILKGTECDILANGDLDWSDAVLSSFEFVVASVHSSFNMSEKEMTKRIVKALKNKHVTMLGHPTGRLLLERDGYQVDMVEVINAASDYGKVLEINSHPMRLDLDWRLCKYAKEKKVMISINPDAHNVESLRDVAFGVGIARKGWLEPTEVLNARELNGVIEYLNIN